MKCFSPKGPLSCLSPCTAHWSLRCTGDPTIYRPSRCEVTTDHMDWEDCKVGHAFGPTWSTHFVDAEFTVTDEGKAAAEAAVLHFVWDSDCEAMGMLRALQGRCAVCCRDCCTVCCRGCGCAAALVLQCIAMYCSGHGCAVYCVLCAVSLYSLTTHTGPQSQHAMATLYKVCLHPPDTHHSTRL